MVYKISRPEVLNNLVRFRDNLVDMQGEESRKRKQEQEEEKEKKGRHKNRVYKVLLNRKTGDMRFAQKISALEQNISKKKGKKEPVENWKEIHIIVHQKSASTPTRFEVKDAKKQDLNPSELDPLAWRVASETIDVLNLMAQKQKGLDERAVLKELSSVRVIDEKAAIENLQGWMGSLSRIEAEEILETKPKGTYLIREGDEITVSIAFHFAEENLLSIHPYVLTVVEDEEKISDLLLLQTDKGWILYHDEPNLKDLKIYKYFSAPQDLLQSIKKIAKYPLA